MSVVMLVEGSADARRRMVRILTGDGLQVAEAGDGLEALRIAFEQRPDTALIDLSSEGIDGFELIKILRAACDIPILAMSTSASSVDIVRALDSGADDVLAKDCLAAEFLARLRSTVRRYQRRQSDRSPVRQVATGSLVIDREAQVVMKHGEIVPLTRTEYRLMDALAARVGETAPHRYLLSTVWGDQFVDDTHYLRVYIGYLRQKLEDDPAQPLYFTNDWGVGYRLARLPIIDDATDVTRQPSYAAAG
jgi:two-component system, OmpR family, KDP operon response regulator KdpE